MMLEPADIFPRESDAAPLIYDPAVHLVAGAIDNGLFHTAWISAEYAVALVERGSPAEIQRAEAVIHAVLDCQDTDARSPHYGNFKWEHEDEAVEDLNAVQFVLIRLIPLLLSQSDCLSSDLVERARARIRLGLDEIRRIDVSPIYSNIVAQDIANSLLGGQLLNLPAYTRRGAEKLREWLRLIDESGIPHEYNSPTYAFVLHRSAAQNSPVFGSGSGLPARAIDHLANWIKRRPAPSSRNGPPCAAALPRLLSVLGLRDDGRGLRIRPEDRGRHAAGLA